MWQFLATCEELTLPADDSWDNLAPEWTMLQPPAVAPEIFRLRKLRLNCHANSQPTILSFLHKLQPYAAALESLEVHARQCYLEPRLDQIPTVYDFPRLHHLHLEFGYVLGVVAQPCAIANACASTLRNLLIGSICNNGTERGEEIPTLSAWYSHLHTVRLQLSDLCDDDKSTFNMLGAISQTRFPALKILSLENAPPVAVTQLPADCVLHQTKVRFVQARKQPSGPSLLTYRLSANGLLREYDAANLRSGRLRWDIDETLDWLTRRIKHVREIGDLRALSRLAHAMGGIAAERALMEL